jgi:glycosyltransferase involved in cell wall biosynthesis
MKAKVLLVPDVPGWAFDFRCNELWRRLGDRYEFTKVYLSGMPDCDYRAFDVLYYAGFFMPHSRGDRARAGREKIVTSISGARTRTHDQVEVMLMRSKAAAALNRDLYEEFKGAPGVRIDLVYNGVDCSLFSPADRPRRNGEGFVVGWAGRRKIKAEIKRLGAIEAAVASIPGASLETRLFESRVPREEMPAFYRSLDCYCCASVSEGHSNTVAEAAACGVPIVSTPTGTSDELLANGRGLLVKPDLSDLADALRMVMGMGPQDRAGMGLLARQYVEENWDWARQALKYAALFDYILEDRR